MDDMQYAEKLAKWQARPEWLVEAVQLIDRMGIKENDAVLDVGTGLGRMLAVLRNEYRAGAIGMEPNSYLRNIMYSSGRRFRVVPDMIAAAQIAPQGYDGIIISHVLGHTDNPKELLASAFGLLAPKGVLGLVVPNTVYDTLMVVPNWFTGYKSDPTLKWDLTPDDLGYMVGTVVAEWAVTQGCTASFAIEYFYMGEAPIWIPNRMAPNWVRSRLAAVIRKT